MPPHLLFTYISALSLKVSFPLFFPFALINLVISGSVSVYIFLVLVKLSSGVGVQEHKQFVKPRKLLFLCIYWLFYHI